MTEPYVLDIDMKLPTYVNEPVVKQRDDVTIVVNLLDNGLPYDFTDSTTLTLTVARLDKVSVTVGGTKTDDNQIVFKVPRSAVSVIGRAEATIQIYGSDGRSSSTTFFMSVHRDPSNQLVGEGEKTLIEVVLSEGPAIIADAQTAAVEAQKVADDNLTRFLEAVSTVALRDSSYPNPKHGDTVRVTSEAKTYRYERDAGWVVTDAYNPTAIDDVSSQLKGKASVQEVSSLTQQLAETASDLAGRGVNLLKFQHLKIVTADGDDWSPVFQAAFDYAGNNKEFSLEIPPLIYTLTQEIFINYPIRINFQKGAKIRVVKSDASRLSNGIINIRSSGVEITGGVVDVQSVDMRGIFAEHSHDLRINNLVVLNAGMAGIWISYSDRVNVEGLYFDNCLNGTYGDNRAGSLRFNYCNDLSVDTVIIENTHGKGLALQGCKVFEISRIFVKKTFFASAGIYFNNSSDGTVTRSSVVEADGNAIKFSRGSTHIQVTLSSFSVQLKTEDDGTTGYVALFQGASHCSIVSSDIFTRGSSLGIRVEDHPEPEGADTAYILIDNNLIDCTGDSWRVRESLLVSVEVRVRPDITGYQVHNVEITRNKILGGLQAVRATNVSGVTIERNECIGQYSTAIQITASEVIKSVRVNGNKITDVNGYGISLYKVEDFEVIKNEVKALPDSMTSTFGISVGTLCKIGSVNDNRVYGFTNSLISSASNDCDTISYIGNMGVGINTTARGLDFRGNNARIIGNQFSSVAVQVYVSPSSVDVTVDSKTPTKNGVLTMSGDGVTKTVLIPHGLGVIPKTHMVYPNSRDAGDAGIQYWIANATDITVLFKAAPISGTNNVKLQWKVES